MDKRAIIIGAGPAGLTAAYELLTRTNIKPVVLEKSTYMGGISRTINYKGNRMDIGGHRFFSKSDRVMNWWFQHLPLVDAAAESQSIAYQGKARSLSAFTNIAGEAGQEERGIAVLEAREAYDPDRVMLVRNRKSRIYFLRKFFTYPIQLSKDTLQKLGFLRTLKIGISYVLSMSFPIRTVSNLEHFFINRFGRELYKTFFKSYTEKVWGVSCEEISAEWGEQRIKGLSIRKAIMHYLRKTLAKRGTDLAQKETETSLIEQFLYPKYGPGQMWEVVAEEVQRLGGQIITEFDVTGLQVESGRLSSLTGTDRHGDRCQHRGEYFFSTMPVQELIRSFDIDVPEAVREISEGLVYRDFITVGILLDSLKVGDGDRRRKLINDNWIYIQEPDVLLGRLQIFNNWSPHLVKESTKVWLGAEYFCNEGDDLWMKPDDEMGSFAIAELDKIGIIDTGAVRDFTVVRVPKTYPAYFGTYSRFDEVRQYLDGYENLFLIGRNGMHKYNNQDHSMLTAMTAVDNIISGRTDKSNIWAVNTEMEYHESK